MRIWLLTSEFPPDVAGGIATYVDTFARLLGGHGHEAVVFTPSVTECDQIVAPGVRVIRFRPRAADGVGTCNSENLTDTDPRYPYNILAHPAALSYQLAEHVLSRCTEVEPPHIVESQEYLGLPYYLLLRKLTERTPLEQTPVLVQLHGPDFEVARVNQEARYRFPRYWVGQMERFCIVAADAVLSPSRFLADRVQQTLRRPVNITTIPLPLAVGDTRAGIAPRRGEVVYVGRLEVRKGVLALVRACSRLWAAGEEFRLTLIGGDTALRPRGTTVGAFIAEHCARWIDSGNLRLLGPVSRAQVLRHIQEAWAVVVPSVWDNFPNVCMEAMGLGQVVLASVAGGQAEMVRGADGAAAGVLFDWTIAGDFDDKLRQVLALSDPERLEISRAAQRHIRELCAPDIILEQRLRHYEAAIGNCAARRQFPTVNNAHSRPAPGAAEHAERGLLSVIITGCERRSRIEPAIENVLRVTYAPLEMLIVADAPATEAEVEAWRHLVGSRAHSFHVITDEPPGSGSICDIAADVARGEFVTLLEADGLVAPDFYARAIDVLNRYANVSFVYSWVRHAGDLNAIWPTWNTEFPYLLGQNMPAAFAVIRRDALSSRSRHAAEMEYGLQDLETWIALVRAGAVGVSLPFPLVQSQVCGRPAFRNADPSALLYLHDLLTQFHAEPYREWGVEMANLLNANGPSYLWRHPATAPEGGPAVTALRALAVRLIDAVGTIQGALDDHHPHLQELAACRDELIAILGYSPPWRTATADDWYDQELGARLVKRVRASWLGGRLLRNDRLRLTMRRLLGV